MGKCEACKKAEESITDIEAEKDLFSAERDDWHFGYIVGLENAINIIKANKQNCTCKETQDE